MPVASRTAITVPRERTVAQSASASFFHHIEVNPTPTEFYRSDWCNLGTVFNDSDPDRAQANIPRRPGARWASGVFALVFAGAVVSLNALQIRALTISKGIDQTYLLESLVNTVHGRFFVTTHAITSLGGWGAMDHFWPGMLLFVPLVAVVEDPIVLYFINAVSLTLAGLVIFAIARRVLADEWLALLCSLAFWTMPEVYYAAITGCWPEVWAMPWLAMMFLAFYERRPVLFSVAAVLLMSFMEQMLLFVGLFSILELFGRRQRVWILLPAVLSSLWLGMLAVAAQSFGASRLFVHEVGLEWGRVVDFFRGLLLDPNRSPLVYLALVFPVVFVIVAPVIVIVIIWGFDLALIPPNDGVLRYGFFLYVVIVVGGIKGLQVVSRVAAGRSGQPPRRVAGMVLGLILIAHIAALARMAPAELPRYQTDEADDLAWSVIRELPPDARVASNRQISYAFLGRAELFVGLWEFPPPLRVKELYFDERNVPAGRWLAEDKFPAMGRHTPGVFILDLDEVGRPVVARGLWVDRNFPVHVVRAAEATGDGRVDIVLKAPDGRIAVYRGFGSLEFEHDPSVFELPAGTRIAAPSPRHLRAAGERAGVNGSGWIELADDQSGLIVFSGVREDENPTEVDLGGFIEEIAIGDLDGDGWDEVVVLDSRRYRLWILRWSPEGELTRTGPFEAPPVPTSVTMADLDGDGAAEIVVTKTQILFDLDAFNRFLDHEAIDHLFWYGDALGNEFEAVLGDNTDWEMERSADLRYFHRLSRKDPGAGTRVAP